ncbi:MAG: LuxR family transcriptional regulator [Brevundimonas sp.]|uniref:helix-turn-helix domain-containing protein n=1 Tax=Brevundimonas sp. TaxID=1871086 RepID=UPI001215A087|nr:helix-turn-helix transcriptional regulator [Brevundimonas sp.]RZJ19138.1 MAG: LuxR family transcriptional regulator [Brevundimonas sp.]
MEPLSPRQEECLRLSATMSDKEIARELGLSPHTVNQHIRQATARLGCTGRREALRALLKNSSPPATGMADGAPPSDGGWASADRPPDPEAGGALFDRPSDAIYRSWGRWREPPRIGGSRLPLIVGWAVAGMVVLIVFSGLLNALFGTLEMLEPSFR